MNQAKITFQLGDLSFVGEGSETWVRAQLEFVLSKIPQMAVRAASPAPSVEREIDRLTNKEVGSSYIKSKGGESNQVTRFLATADWLRLRGEKTLKTTLVSKALRENHQSKLTNPAESLNKNVSKGYCEKSGDGFFITPEGLRALGH